MALMVSTWKRRELVLVYTHALGIEFPNRGVGNCWLFTNSH